jgi:hypothetical protein
VHQAPARASIGRVMKPSTMASALFTVTALSLGACEGDGSSSGRGYGYVVVGCNQYTSCEACTPFPGCGWCDKDDGTGMCADDPNDCAASTVFRWTWEPSGCHVLADAAVGPSDAASQGDGVTAE